MLSPQFFILDRNPGFVCKFLQTLFKLLQSKIILPSEYYSEEDGPMDLMSRKSDDMRNVAMDSDESNWALYFTHFQVA